MFQVKDNSMGNLKYTGIARAVVVDNDDPLKRGRIRVNTPVLGETNWIPYLTAPGHFSVPEIDSVVYVQCDGGFYTHPVAWGNLNYGADDDLQFPEEFQRVSPTNRGIYSPGGHLLEIDDGTDLTGTNNGIRFTASNGTLLHIDAQADSIKAKVVFGDNWELSKANGFQVFTPAAGGTSLSMKSGKIELTSTLDMTLKSTTGSLIIDAPTSIGLSSDSLVSIAGGTDASIGTSLGGAKLNISGGKIALGNDSAELFDLFDQDLDAFINNASTLALTSVGPGVLNPSVVTLLTNIKTFLALVKGSL